MAVQRYIPGKSGVAVITGGASGIGRALAARLRDGGMTVVIADLDRDRVLETGSALGVAAFKVDVTDRTSLSDLRGEVLYKFGAIHVICNNAGVGQYQDFLKMSDDDWRWIIDVNFWGTIYGVREFLPTLLANEDGGHVINTLSMRAFAGHPGAGAYAASKFAALGATECLRDELIAAHSAVGCTAFCPGPVESDIAESYARHQVRSGIPVEAVRKPDAAGAYPRMAASEAADIAIDAYVNNKFWAITHPDLMTAYHQRNENILKACQ